MSLRHVPHAPGDWEAPPQMPRGAGRRPLKCPGGLGGAPSDAPRTLPPAV